MNIVNQKPPIYKQILQTNLNFNPDLTIFTYGDTIYNPAGIQIPDYLITHEETHMRQQGANPDAWWERYLHDQYFRIDQEAEAYANEYRHLCRLYKDRNRQNMIVIDLARILAGPMYGSVISTSDAMKMIKLKAKK